MARLTYDIVFLGGGAGVEGAIRAQALGLRAAAVERERLGGAMLQWGVPLLTLLHTAAFFKDAASSETLGLRLVRPVLRYDELLARKDRIEQRLADDVAARLQAAGATILHGEGVPAEPGLLRVADEGGRETMVEAKRIVIMTGSRPQRPTGLTPDGEQILTTDDALRLREVPQRVCIVGAGPSGCEFASLYAALGSQVTLLEREASMLPRLDIDLGRELAAHFAALGVSVYTNVSSVSAGRVAEGVQVTYVAAGQKQTVTAEKVLLATGRIPNTSRLGLGRLGVAMDENDSIRVNERFETSVPGLSAAGDVTGEPMLAHRAAYEAQTIAELEAGRAREADQPAGIVVHGLLQTASVGLSEGHARERFGGEVKVKRARFGNAPAALIRNEAPGFWKLVFDPGGRLAGAHLTGVQVSDALALLTLAIRQGARATDLRGVMPGLSGFPLDRLLLEE